MDVPFPKAMKAHPTLRQSLLANFDNCGLSTKFEIDYRKGWSSHPQGRGQLTHRTLAKCLEEMFRNAEDRIEVDVALAILHEVLRQADVDDYCHEPGCDQPAQWIAESKRRADRRSLVCTAGHRHHSSVVNVPMAEVKDLYWIVVKWASENTFDIAHLVEVERRLEATVRYPNPNGGFVERRITGQLDAWLLDAEDPTHAIVLDWKDTWALPPQTELSFEGYFQQRFYALLVMRSMPSISKVTLREFYVRYSTPREVTIHRDEIDSIEDEFSALVERFDRTFETKNWTPTPGKHCTFCSRPAKCPIPVFVRGDGRIHDEDQAQRVAAQLLTADVVVKQTTKALRAWSELHGPVPVKNAKGESFYGFEEYERVSRPSEEKADQAQRQGVPVASLFKRAKATRFGLLNKKPKTAEQEDAEIMAALEKSVEQAKRRAA